MTLVLRALFLLVVRPVGAVLRGRDPLRLKKPPAGNWGPGPGR